VIGLVLRGVYLGRKWENQWLFQEGASIFYPERYQDYLAPIPPAERDDLISAYYHRLSDPNESVHLAAAKSWSDWEGGMVRLVPDENKKEESPLTKLAIARFECHYIVHEMFFPVDNYILENAGSIAHLPCRIVHGRYDVICPARNAWELHRVLPQSKLVIVQDGAHAARDPGMASELVQALDDLQSLFE
jgi:proline iminopeptidase